MLEIHSRSRAQEKVMQEYREDGRGRILQRKNHGEYEKAAEIAPEEENIRDWSKLHCSCNSSSYPLIFNAIL